MGKRGRVLIAVAAITVLAVLAWTVLRSPATPPEPVYQGKPLSYWLQAYGNFTSDTNLPTSGEANIAVREIGPDAIPTLLRMLRAHDSPLKTKFLNWTIRYRYFRLHYQSAGTVNMEAIFGFHALGPDAYRAVPELIRILDDKASSNSAMFSTMILAGIGPGARTAVPSLLRIAADTNQSMRNHAIFALGRIHANPDTALPVLIKALQDPYALNRPTAVFALEQFHEDAKPAVPALVALLSMPDVNSSTTLPPPRVSVMSLHAQVEQALHQIDPDTYYRVVTNAEQTPIPYR